MWQECGREVGQGVDNKVGGGALITGNKDPRILMRYKPQRDLGEVVGVGTSMCFTRGGLANQNEYR